MSADTTVEQTMKIYREQHPDAFERVDVIARIIDPGAFSEWTASDDETQSLVDCRMRYLQSVAIGKACDILKVLGVNMDTDWIEIIEKLPKVLR